MAKFYDYSSLFLLFSCLISGILKQFKNLTPFVIVSYFFFFSVICNKGCWLC